VTREVWMDEQTYMESYIGMQWIMFCDSTRFCVKPTSKWWV
jgi:hypothetical protein